jgi:hypothetical protein
MSAWSLPPYPTALAACDSNRISILSFWGFGGSEFALQQQPISATAATASGVQGLAFTFHINLHQQQHQPFKVHNSICNRSRSDSNNSNSSKSNIPAAVVKRYGTVVEVKQLLLYTSYCKS